MPSLAINRLRIVKQVDNHSFNLAKNIPMQATLQTPKFFTWLSLSWGDRVVVLVTKKKKNKIKLTKIQEKHIKMQLISKLDDMSNKVLQKPPKLKKQM